MDDAQGEFDAGQGFSATCSPKASQNPSRLQTGDEPRMARPQVSEFDRQLAFEFASSNAPVRTVSKAVSSAAAPAWRRRRAVRLFPCPARVSSGFKLDYNKPPASIQQLFLTRPPSNHGCSKLQASRRALAIPRSKWCGFQWPSLVPSTKPESAVAGLLMVLPLLEI